MNTHADGARSPQSFLIQAKQKGEFQEQAGGEWAWWKKVLPC